MSLRTRGGGINVGPAATPTAVASGTADAQAVAAATALRLMGYSVRESAGTPAVAALNLRHGTLDSDPLVELIELAADESYGMWFGPNGIDVPNGVFVERVTGETEIVIHTAT